MSCITDLAGPRYLIQGIVPHRRVHLVAGPSGGGKTTWILQILITEWSLGHPVLDHDSYPVPWAYVSGDRSYEEIIETLERLQLLKANADSMHLVSAVDQGIFDLDVLIEQCLKFEPRPKLIVVEGLVALMAEKSDPNKYKDVARFLSKLTRKCQQEDITIIGVLHSPKMKEDAEYLNPRQRISGSVAWAAFSSTILLMEPLITEEVKTAPVRRLYVLPRNRVEFHRDYQFNSEGRLVEIQDELMETLFVAFLESKKPGDLFTRADVEDRFAGKLASATITRYLQKAVADGRIERLKQGVYRVKSKH